MCTKANKSTDLRAKQKAEILEFLGFYELVDPSTLDNAEATISAKRSQFIEQFEKSHPKKCKDFIAYYDSSAIHDSQSGESIASLAMLSPDWLCSPLTGYALHLSRWAAPQQLRSRSVLPPQSFRVFRVFRVFRIRELAGRSVTSA